MNLLDLSLLDARWRRANARNVSTPISLWWSVDQGVQCSCSIWWQNLSCTHFQGRAEKVGQKNQERCFKLEFYYLLNRCKKMAFLYKRMCCFYSNGKFYWRWKYRNNNNSVKITWWNDTYMYSQSMSCMISIFEIWMEFWNLHVSFEHCRRDFRVSVSRN